MLGLHLHVFWKILITKSQTRKAHICKYINILITKSHPQKVHICKYINIADTWFTFTEITSMKIDLWNNWLFKKRKKTRRMFELLSSRLPPLSQEEGFHEVWGLMKQISRARNAMNDNLLRRMADHHLEKKLFSNDCSDSSFPGEEGRWSGSDLKLSGEKWKLIGRGNGLEKKMGGAGKSTAEGSEHGGYGYRPKLVWNSGVQEYLSRAYGSSRFADICLALTYALSLSLSFSLSLHISELTIGHSRV